MKKILAILILSLSLNTNAYSLNVQSEEDCTQLYNMDEKELGEEMQKPDFQIQDLITECQTKFNNTLAEEPSDENEPTTEEPTTKSKRKPASQELQEENDTLVPSEEDSENNS